MELMVIGGSRGTGAELATLAQNAGHEVTTISRSGGTVQADAKDPPSIAPIISGADAVVITVGGAKGVSRNRAQVTKAVVQAMTEQGVRSSSSPPSEQETPASTSPRPLPCSPKPFSHAPWPITTTKRESSDAQSSSGQSSARPD